MYIFCVPYLYTRYIVYLIYVPYLCTLLVYVVPYWCTWYLICVPCTLFVLGSSYEELCTSRTIDEQLPMARSLLAELNSVASLHSASLVSLGVTRFARAVYWCNPRYWLRRRIQYNIYRLEATDCWRSQYNIFWSRLPVLSPVMFHLSRTTFFLITGYQLREQAPQLSVSDVSRSLHSWVSTTPWVVT